MESQLEQKLIRWIQSDKLRIYALKRARELSLPDWCLAAGFVRNLVWDKTHDYHVATPLNDIDLVYFDAKDIDERKEKLLEIRLKHGLDLPWSVKNQARMHHRNNDSPYESTEDAMSYWPEVETAIGARLNQNNKVEIIAPFGLMALFDKTISINPKRSKPEIFKQRINKKCWLTRWPDLAVIDE